MTLIIDGHGVPVHRKVMQWNSPYFVSLGNQSEISIEKYSFPTMEVILKYLYEKSFDIEDIYIVQEVFLASRFFGIVCFDFFFLILFKN